jgi:hypothetical protein
MPAMCANCVAQGAVYVGGALTGLQVMAARARSRRRTGVPAVPVARLERRPDGPSDAEPRARDLPSTAR